MSKQLVLHVTVGIGALALASAAFGQTEKAPRRGLPFYGVESIDNALRDAKGSAGSAKEMPAAKSEGAREFNRVMSICGPTTDWDDVELYSKVKPTPAFVNGRQPAVAQIQWRANLASRLGNGVDPGNVDGQRWCTGTLIAPNLFLTAAHCFQAQDDKQGWQTPRRKVSGGTQLLKAQDLAPLMQLNFRYQVNGSDPKKRLRTADVYPIVRLVEYGFDEQKPIDYAIVEVGKDAQGRLPDAKYAITAFDASEASLKKAKQLTIIQHPHGEPKKVMAGPSVGVEDELLLYKDLDTLGGSSGSGVLDEAGKVIAVHVAGGCYELGGANRGVPLTLVRKVSQIVK